MWDIISRCHILPHWVHGLKGLTIEALESQMCDTMTKMLLYPSCMQIRQMVAAAPARCKYLAEGEGQGVGGDELQLMLFMGRVCACGLQSTKPLCCMSPTHPRTMFSGYFSYVYVPPAHNCHANMELKCECVHSVSPVTSGLCNPGSYEAVEDELLGE